jgi:hypothetical protein
MYVLHLLSSVRLTPNPGNDDQSRESNPESHGRNIYRVPTVFKNKAFLIRSKGLTLKDLSDQMTLVISLNQFFEGT